MGRHERPPMKIRHPALACVANSHESSSLCGGTQLCQINAVNFWDSPLAQSQSLRPPEWWSHKVIPRAEGRRQYQHNLRLQILPRSELSTVVEVGSHSPGKCNFWELPSRNTPELGLDNSLRYAAAKD